MRHYSARKRADNDRWDYTCGTGPIGYCGGYKPFTEKHLKTIFFNSQERMDEANAKMAAHKDKYHTDGHSTKDEACECYKLHELDNNLRLGGKMTNQQLRCEICGEFTDKTASIAGRYEHFVLCDKHQNRESVEKIFDIGESWAS